jgi:hypothetical protein
MHKLARAGYYAGEDSEMSKLTTAERNALPASDFAGPGRSYPVEDKAHAAAAKSRASQFAGPKLKSKIDKKADKKLGKRDGGKR